jgi:hypothetical protein
LYERQEDAHISFETYIVLIEGIQAHGVPIHTCKECNSTYAWPVGSYIRHSCPVCAIHQHSAKSAKTVLADRLASKAAQGSVVASGSL